MRTKRHILGGAVLTAGLLLGSGPAHAVSTPFVYEGSVRAAGPDRYATAAVISQGSFAPSAGSAVFLANGTSFADALAAGPAAAAVDGPLLLTTAAGLPQPTVEELNRLKPSFVHVVGGPNQVPEAILTQIRTLLPTATVDRTAGADRYATAVAIANRFFPADQASFVLARGDAFPDATSGAALAGWRGEPLLLTAPNDLPDVVIGWLSAADRARTTVVGGVDSVSDAVVDETDLFLTDADAVSRLSGTDRYDTSAVVARTTYADAEVAVIATGRNFPDALAAVPAAAVNGAPLLLVPGECTPGTTADYLERNSSLRASIVVGAEAAVSTESFERNC